MTTKNILTTFFSTTYYFVYQRKVTLIYITLTYNIYFTLHFQFSTPFNFVSKRKESKKQHVTVVKNTFRLRDIFTLNSMK